MTVELEDVGNTHEIRVGGRLVEKEKCTLEPTHFCS